MPFNFSDHILHYLDSTNTSSTFAFRSPPSHSHHTLTPANSSQPDTSAPPCPAPPPAFSPCTIPPPPQLAPPALFPPLPPIPNLHLTDQQANNLTDAVLRVVAAWSGCLAVCRKWRGTEVAGRSGRANEQGKVEERWGWMEDGVVEIVDGAVARDVISVVLERWW